MVPREHVDRALEFISAMDSEIERITKLSLEAEKDLQHETIPDEIVGKIRYGAALCMTLALLQNHKCPSLLYITVQPLILTGLQ